MEGFEPAPEPGASRAGHVWRAGAALLVAVAVVAGLVTLVGDEDPDGRAADCSPARAAGVRTDTGMTRAFARYGDDNKRTDDWTGGDGTRSVALPDGRTLWLFADTFLDRVYPGGRRVPQPNWVRNSAVVMSREGDPVRTLTGTGPAGGPAALFPGTATPDGREVWRWPVDAVVEPRRPGADEQVVRVLLWQREAADAPWVFGMPRATEVATLSLPELRLEGIEQMHRPPQGTAPGSRVLYGTSAARSGGWTYVFGADERGTTDGGPSRTYVARAPRGALGDAGAWRHWTGSGWTSDASAAAPMEVGGDRGTSAATNTYTVARLDGTWLLLTMDAGGPDRRASPTVVSYWSCGPNGPWHGPDRAAVPSLPPGGDGAGVTPYNPQAHPSVTRGDGLLLSYDVNVLGDVTAIHQDVSRYRPRFLRLDLASP